MYYAGICSKSLNALLRSDLLKVAKRASQVLSLVSCKTRFLGQPPRQAAKRASGWIVDYNFNYNFNFNFNFVYNTVSESTAQIHPI